jgi:hypothetical protein
VTVEWISCFSFLSDAPLSSVLSDENLCSLRLEICMANFVYHHD